MYTNQFFKLEICKLFNFTKNFQLAHIKIAFLITGEAGVGIVKGIMNYMRPSSSTYGTSNAPSQFDILSNQVPNEETLQKGNFLRSITLTPNTYKFSTPQPSGVATPKPAMHQQQQHQNNMQFSTPTPGSPGFHYASGNCHCD